MGTQTAEDYIISVIKSAQRVMKETGVGDFGRDHKLLIEVAKMLIEAEYDLQIMEARAKTN